eukprot:Nk52_evm32s2402 gene=Nk52_evmTU32s2402
MKSNSATRRRSNSASRNRSSGGVEEDEQLVKQQQHDAGQQFTSSGNSSLSLISQHGMNSDVDPHKKSKKRKKSNQGSNLKGSSEDLLDSKDDLLGFNTSPVVNPCYGDNGGNGSNNMAMKGGGGEEGEVVIRVYSSRWIALGLFSILSMSNAIMWISFATIADDVKERLSIGDGKLNLLSTIYMIVYIPGLPVASFLIDRLSLGAGIWTGAILNAGGGWLRFVGARNADYWTVFAGQFCCALAQTFILGIPAKVSAVWFPAHQRALSTGVAVFFNQLGNGLGLVLPAIAVHQSGDVVDLMLIEAICVSAIAVLILPLFGKGPPSPPSVAEAVREPKRTRELLASSVQDYWALIKDIRIFALVMAYGIDVGVFYGISTFLSPILKSHHPDADAEIGWCGFIMVATGLVSAVLFSVYAGHTGRYYLVSMVSYVGALLSLLLFTFLAVQQSSAGFGLLYTLSGVVGFFLTALLPVGVEYAAEIAFPVVENISSGLLNMFAQIWGVIIIFSLEDCSVSVMMYSMCGVLALGLVCMGAVSRDLKRSRVEENFLRGRETVVALDD